jgi:tetratricopeptide (TPR) repeat protein
MLHLCVVNRFYFNNHPVHYFWFCINRYSLFHHNQDRWVVFFSLSFNTPLYPRERSGWEIFCNLAVHLIPCFMALPHFFRKLCLFPALLLTTAGLQAQTPDLPTMQETARNFIRQGDHNNAVLVLNKALQQFPDNLDLQKDLAFAYYLQRDYSKALAIIKPLMDRVDSDVQSFQIGGNIYKAINETKDCEKMYKTALRKFPRSGVLYAEYGELLGSTQKGADAIEIWEKGIEMDPGFASNYYMAANYYFYKENYCWSILYGEQFVNVESLSGRTAETKGMLLESYKKLFLQSDITAKSDKKNPFVQAFLSTLGAQSSLVSAGVSPDVLVMIRTRFLLSWDEKYATKFPYKLFDLHRQLLRDGMFTAYNQWLFGPAADLAAYDNWAKTHNDAYLAFVKYQRNRVYKIPAGQYYQTK